MLHGNYKKKKKQRKIRCIFPASLASRNAILQRKRRGYRKDRERGRLDLEGERHYVIIACHILPTARRKTLVASTASSSSRPRSALPGSATDPLRARTYANRKYSYCTYKSHTYSQQALNISRSAPSLTNFLSMQSTARHPIMCRDSQMELFAFDVAASMKVSVWQERALHVASRTFRGVRLVTIFLWKQFSNFVFNLKRRYFKHLRFSESNVPRRSI